MNKQQAALMVLGNMDLGANKPPQLDPILAGVIVQLLEWAIPKCADWIMNNKKVTPTPTPGPIKMMILRHQTKKAFGMVNGSVANFKTHGEPLVQAIVKTYKEATPDQISSLLQGK
jgi:hypothetical protein